MSGRRRSTLSPTLFPFLAVLVCTLGTLILFLALVAQNAADSAAKTARAEAQQERLDETPSLTSATVDSMIAEEEIRVAQLVAFRDEQAADLESRRDHLTHIEDHLQRIRDELKRLSDEVKVASGETMPEPVDANKLAIIKARLLDEKKAIEELKEKTDSNSPRVVIVPHKGPNGTDRRPVYLECTEKAVVIWPEGSKITIDQLNKSRSGANPLDAALRTIRHHAMQNYGDTIPPYPLLVVRPDGIQTYGSARQAMKDWDEQFGYELIPEEIELAFQQPDPNLKKRMDRAIHAAVSNQRMMERAARIALSRGAGGASIVPRGSAATRGGKLPTLSAAQLDRQGRSAGFGSLRESDVARLQNAASSLRHDDWKKGLEGDETLQGNHQSSGLYGQSGNELGEAAIASISPKLENEMQSAANAISDNGTDSDGRTVDGELRNRHTGQNLVGNGIRPADVVAAQKSVDIDRRLNQTLGDLEMPNSQTEPFKGHPIASASSDPPSLADLSSGGSDDLSDQTKRPKSNGFTTMDDASISSAGASNQTSAGAAMPHGQGGQPAPPPDGQLSGTAALQNPNPPKGKDWALPRHVALSRGNTIVRTIRAICYPDQIVLLGAATSRRQQSFSNIRVGGSHPVVELGDAVKQRVASWGPSLPGGRWTPILEVEVMPGAEESFEQLRDYMDGSGVEVQGRKQ